MKMAAQRSPKIARLQQLSGMSYRETIATVELLWLFTMEQTPQGDLGKWTDADIETACDWNDEPGFLVACLIEAVLLDPCTAHRLVVHDWADHAPEFLQKREGRAQKRGEVYFVRPCPPSGDQRPPASDVVGQRPNREGKGRVGKPRVAKPSQGGSGGKAAGAAPASRSRVRAESPSKGATLFPADGLTTDQKKALAARPVLAGFTPAQFGHAVNQVAEWGRSNGKKKIDWVATVASAMLDGWGLKGFVNGPGAPDPPRRGGGNSRGRESTYSPPVTSPGWEEDGEIQRAFAEQDAEQPKEPTT